MMYDVQRLRALLLSCADLGAEALCDAVLAALDEYQGDAGQFDDLTMLVVEVSRPG